MNLFLSLYVAFILLFTPITLQVDAFVSKVNVALHDQTSLVAHIHSTINQNVNITVYIDPSFDIKSMVFPNEDRGRCTVPSGERRLITCTLNVTPTTPKDITFLVQFERPVCRQLTSDITVQGTSDLYYEEFVNMPIGIQCVSLPIVRR